MRDGSRQVSRFRVTSGLWLALVLLPAVAVAEDAPLARLAVEIVWGDASLPPLADPEPTPPLELTITAGSISEAAQFSVDRESLTPLAPLPEGGWRLGGAPSGIVRAQIDAPLSAALLFRCGDAAARVPIAALLESPQQTPPPLPIRVQRLAWDAIEVERLEGDGIQAPGSILPVSVVLNTPAESLVSTITAVVRPTLGGDPVWSETREVQTRGGRSLPLTWKIPAPLDEGSYVLEFTASWGATMEGEGSSRIARLLRRRRAGSSTITRRRYSFVVVEPRQPASPPNSGATESLIDLVETTRIKNSRWVTSGRSAGSGSIARAWPIPREALAPPAESSRRERLMAWITRPADLSLLPASDASGLAWIAASLRVNRPGRPHRLVVTLTGGVADALAVGLIDTRGEPRLLLDACAWEPSGPREEPRTFSWLVWPQSTEVLALLANRADSAAVRVAAIELRELASDPAPVVLDARGPEPERRLALQFAGGGALDRFGGRRTPDGEPADLVAAGRNLVAYLAHCGANTVVLSAKSNAVADSVGRGQLEEDPFAPDRDELLFRLLSRAGIGVVLDVPLRGGLAGLPEPGSEEAARRGLVALHATGEPDGTRYSLLHPEVRKALRVHLVTALEARVRHPNILGLLVTMGSGTSLPPGGATVPDDETYRLFLSSSFQPADLRRIRGQSEPVPARYGERKQFLAEEGSKPWAEWRAAEVGQLYAELAAAVNEASPGAKLLVTTPNLQEGPARVEALRVDRLGLSPSDVWKSLGLDLAAWPAESPGLVVLRTIAGSPREPLRDHATHSDLDRPVALRKERGVILGHRESFAQGAMELAAIPTTHESMGDEQLAHGLAAIDPHWTIVSGTVVASQEERLGRYARVIRPLPSEPPIGNVSGRQDSGIRTRVWTSGGETLIAIANDTPYRVLLENNLEGPADASVTDLGRRQRLLPAIATNGGRSLVLELPPFGVQTIAVASPHVAVQTQAPFLPGLAQLDAEADVISDRLARLAAATHETSTLPNPGCEPVSGTSESPAETRAGSDAQPPGWAAIGDAKAELVADLETPHSGRAAARLRASALPASAVTEQFRPPPDPKLTMRAWLRAQKPQTRVRIWIEGESLGRPITRSLEWSATADWTELRVQAVDLPAVGLEQVRLRFELLDPGTLWIDDVAISGENESSDAGRRAQRELTAALQAYRERRFSDFARLSRSPWARASIQAVSENPPVRTGSAAGSDLPPTRRFR